MPPTLRDWTFFKKSVRRQADALRRYSFRLPGRRLIGPELFADLLNRRQNRLCCANGAARIAFARAAGQHIRRSLTPSMSRPAFFLTLAPRFACMPFYEAKSYDWSELHTWTERQLDGLDYFGSLDLAFFSAHPTSRTKGAFVSFHIHALVWGADRRDMRATVDRINEECASLLPGRPAAHCLTITNIDTAVRLGRYALKPPLRNYRAYPLRDMAGRLREEWTSRKWDLGPGDAARIARVLQRIEIDAICFEGGAGMGFVEAIGRAALRRLRRDEREELRHLKRLLGAR